MLPTEVGKTYGVQFLGSANCVTYSGQSCSTSCSRVLTVGVADDTGAGLAQDVTTPFATAEYQTLGSAQVTPWQPLHFEFTAQSTSTILYFSGSDTNVAGPMIDDVVIPASDCQASTCGNGTLEQGEACDDGNTASGDGCSSDCTQVEVGYTCPTAGQACVATCGDGIKTGTEGCDDGNTTAGDGCSPTCTVEPNYECSVTPPATASMCFCAQGYAPDPSGACIPMDPCATNNGGCDANATCDASTGSVVCTCNSGYVGDGTTCAVDPCAANPCGTQGATCTDTIGGYTCTCNAG